MKRTCKMKLAHMSIIVKALKGRHCSNPGCQPRVKENYFIRCFGGIFAQPAKIMTKL